MMSLTSIEGMEYLNTSEVEDMSYMFSSCESLTSVDLSTLDTSSATDMMGMFLQCYSLKELDLSHFDVSKVQDMSYMFYYCKKLTTVYVNSTWDASNVNWDEAMFEGCTSLMGGEGTVYSELYTGRDYARIDGGPSDPGYFTERKKGDVNADGEVNVSDVTALVSMILGNSTVNAAADVNGDKEVNVSDVTALVSIILGS